MMNVEPLSASSSSGAGGAHVNHRKERGAIAAQACETCRSRKQKCDEQRPKCGTCQKFKLDCRYREPQPTKKDKTLAEILDRLKSLEGKIDHLSFRGSIAPSLQSSTFGRLSSPRNLIDGEDGDVLNHLAPSPALAPSSAPASSTSSHQPSGIFHYQSSSYRMLAWPVVQQLVDTGRQVTQGPIDDESPIALLDLQDRAPALAVGGMESIESMGMNGKMPLNLQLQVPSSSSSTLPLSAAAVNWETLERLSKEYFDTFNLIYPIMDRQDFHNILAVLMQDGFDEGMPTTLACLVFALGEVALSSSAPSMASYKSGGHTVKDSSTIERPPGIAFFNEARKRMGFSLSNCSVENVQMFALAGIYYGSCFHHREYWRMSGAASLACQALLTSKPNKLNSSQGDLIKRLFWHCYNVETCLHLELEVPLSGLGRFEEIVGLVDFSGPFCQEDYIANQTSHFQEHFLSQIVLRKLAVASHSSLTAELGSTTTTPAAGPQSPQSPMAPVAPMSASANSAPSAVVTDGAVADSRSAVSTARQLAAQLDQWHTMLPPFLKWPEGQPGAYSLTNMNMFSQDLATTFMFSPDLSTPPTTYTYSVDVQVALLRSRYYHTKFLIYRPFVYKAVHHGDVLTREDAECVAACLQACLKWPIAMSPTCHNKRLIPYLYFWSQNILSILILLHLTQQVPMLARIRANLCGELFDAAASESIALYLDWFRDLKTIDPVAAWSWTIIRRLYNVND